MQQVMKSVSMPAVPFKKPDFLTSGSSSSDLHSVFRRSRTFDRTGKSPTLSSPASSSTASQFYRTMTQRALGSASRDNHRTDNHSARRQDADTRAAPVVKSIWLVTTSACSCKDSVLELTEALVYVLEQHERNSSHASEAYCQLIDCLGSCGHPSEAKAVFEECLSGSRLLSLERIASQKHFWKPFSSLVRCYVANGLVHRAFDVMVQVKIDEEQCLDPSLGSLCFGAHVLTSESEVLVERVYATFSCGNIGIYLAARDSGLGAEVIAFEEAPALEQSTSDVGAAGAACCVKEYDVVETINGDVMLQYPLKSVVQCLKHAYRPVTITFLRGLPKLESLVSEPSNSDPTSNNHVAGNDSESRSRWPETKLRPRKDLCDRFGLLPQRGIRITTLADCANCGSRASLPEIQHGWSTSDANDYTTQCAKCRHRYVPRLCVMLGVTTAFYQPAEDAQQPACVEQFEYLSMLVVRKELANLAQKIPLTMLSMAELRGVSPRIYWNIVVKLLSLSCPLEFLDLPDMTQPVRRPVDVSRPSGESVDPTSQDTVVAPSVSTASEVRNEDASAQDVRGEEGYAESSEMQELQDFFMRTLHAIQAREGDVSAPFATASRMLRLLEHHTRVALHAEDATEFGSDSDMFAGREDAESDERRSCRTASLADSSIEDVEEEHARERGAQQTLSIRSSLVMVAQSRVSGLAPFQRKVRASKFVA